MNNRILVTGATGFVGQALIPALKTAFPTATVFAVGSGNASSQPDTLGCDLSDRDAVRQLIMDCKPDCVINLAAISHIPTAFANPELTWQINLHGVLHLLDALVELDSPCTFLQAGSGDCYGGAFRSGEAVTEHTAFEPLNPYSASKAAADMACCMYSNKPNLTVIRTRPFNHTGAGQTNRFVLPAFAEQVARIEAGLQPPVIEVGNLDAHRCFLHVNDVVDAYIQLLKEAGNIRSGSAFNIVADQTHSIAAVLEQLLLQSDREIEVKTDPARCRPTDIPMAQGCANALKTQTDWQATTDLPHIIRDVLEYWRTQYPQD